MSVALVPYDATGTVRLDVRLAHTTGNLFTTSPTLDGSGRELADEYTLTASGASGANADITVTTASGRGPYHNRVISGVTFNGATRTDIVPGVTLPTVNTSPSNGWVDVLKVGIWANLLEAGNPTATKLDWSSGVANPGVVAGAIGGDGFIAKLLIKNVSAETTVNSRALIYPRAKIVSKTAPLAFQLVRVTTSTPTERTDGTGKVLPIGFAFANYDSGAGEIDMLMSNAGGAAAPFDVTKLDDNSLVTNAVNLKIDGTTLYSVTSPGMHADTVTFALATTARDASVENMLIFNVRHVWIAPDAGGSPGTWTQGAVTLTQSGQSSGVILPSGTAPLWAKLLVPSTAPIGQNPFPADISVEYGETGEAGWLS